MQAANVPKEFPVICVGGSAGGLEAYTRLLRHLPADMGVAIVTIAQRPETASQPDMPESAISSGCIDFILSPEDIVKKIVQLAPAAGNGQAHP